MHSRSPRGVQQQQQQQRRSLHSPAPACSRLARPQTCLMPASKPLFSFGVISDVQYADIPDGQSFHGVPRYYRNSLVATKRAVVEGWGPARVSFGIHFGDILDAFQPKDKSEEMLNRLLHAFDQGRRTTYHILGNHCCANLPRTKLNQMLQIPPAADGASYYSFSPHPAWRFVVLDAYDISMLGWPNTHPRHLQAAAILERENPNENKNSPEGLVGLQRRFVMFGGGVSGQQLEWLEQQLQEADQQGQCVVVNSHLPILPDTCPPACLIWNYDQVLTLLQQHAGVVVASIAGHAHQNGYLVDASGIHHMVLPGVVEAPPGRDCYGVVRVFPDKLELEGVDICMSCSCKLPAAAVQRQQQAAVAAAAAAVPLSQQQQGQEGVSGVQQGTNGSGSAGGAVSDAVVEVSDAAADVASKLAAGVSGISLEAVAVPATTH